MCVCGRGPPGPLLSPSSAPALQSAHSPHLSFPAHSLTCFHFPHQPLTHIYRPGSFVLCQIINVVLDFPAVVLWTHSLHVLHFFGLFNCYVYLYFMPWFIPLYLTCLPVHFASKLSLNTLWSVSSSAFVLSIWVLSCLWSEPLQTGSFWLFLMCSLHIFHSYCNIQGFHSSTLWAEEWISWIHEIYQRCWCNCVNRNMVSKWTAHSLSSRI